MKKIVIASNNKGKLQEIQAILQPYDIEVINQGSLNIPEAEEPFFTFLENSLAKARHASKISGLPALADDSGLCVEALNFAPGVFSARFAGEPKSDSRNNQKLLKDLEHLAESERNAYFYCVMVFVRHADDPQPIVAEGIWHGRILNQPQGENGFGYDPIFLDLETNLSSAELSSELKNQKSHRGQALNQLISKLKAVYFLK